MKRIFGAFLALVFAAAITGPVSAGEELQLKEGWQLQSSVKLQDSGEVMSRAGYKAEGWYPVTVPTTVLAGLVANKVYPDPYYGVNITKIPGYVSGKWLAMPEDSPFYPSWWYRAEFVVPESMKGKNLNLRLEGINYKANVFLNGKKIAGMDTVAGMFRAFEFPVNQYLKFGGLNALAIETTAPGKLPKKMYLTKQVEAATGWDDHNPEPPDLNVGLWQPVLIRATGPVELKNPYVLSKLDLPDMKTARLTISADLTNVTDQEATAVLAGEIESVKFSQTVKLGPGETRTVTFAPDKFPALNLQNPRVWWPSPLGPQELYELSLIASVEGRKSDDAKTTFGIREITSAINDEGWRQFKVNGKNILIRGGAWMTTDMLLRLSPERYDALVRYAKEAGLNMLRSEGFSIRETEEFYGICDKHGVMVTQQIFGRSIPDEQLAVTCVKDMMLRIRNHPSLVHFLGHDETFPTPTLDAAYRELIAQYIPDRTYQPHSGAFNVNDRFETGGTRTGTLELWTYAGPYHYYTHKPDGAWGFAQSGGIGGIVASAESIKRMMPESDWWPALTTPSWSLHTVIQGGQYFNKMVKALNAKYGAPKDIDEFAMTSHAMNYESARGMFEAYARNKYSSTGITTWKYDAAWPAAMTWQYIDYFLLPTGGYYGAKKACEPLHVQFSYDDNSVWVVNSFYKEFKGLKATAKIFNQDMTEKFSQEATLDAASDGKTKAFVITWPKGLSKSYFLSLKLYDGDGKIVTDNFYWLSTKPERPAKQFFGAVALWPSSYNDHSDLRKLPKVKLDMSCSIAAKGEENIATVTLKNPGKDLAFFVNLAVTKGAGGYQVAPSYWSDNYFALLPGDQKTLTASFAPKNLEGKNPAVKLWGWNIDPTECAPE